MARCVYTVCVLLLSLITTTLSAKVTNPDKVPKNAVLLSKINSLTVRGGQQTASRRVSAVPQLQCVGPPSVCKLYAIDVMRCANEGSGYNSEDVEWSCKASLPEEFKLGSTDVSCEGYESSDDPYVLKGSCGVEYRLLLTEKGEDKYGRHDSTWDGSSSGSETVASYIFFAIFLSVVGIILYNIIKTYRNDSRGPGGRRLPYGGGGGGGGPGDDPPPPYDPYPHSNPPKKTRTYTPRTATGGSSRTAGNQQGWRPGFWTGTATGAAASYLFNNRNQPRATETQQRQGGGLFGGDGGGRSGWGRSQPSSSSSSSTPSFSSSRHESTGFGSTSRRLRSTSARRLVEQRETRTVTRSTTARDASPETLSHLMQNRESFPQPEQYNAGISTIDSQAPAVHHVQTYQQEATGQHGNVASYIAVNDASSMTESQSTSGQDLIDRSRTSTAPAALVHESSTLINSPNHAAPQAQEHVPAEGGRFNFSVSFVVNNVRVSGTNESVKGEKDEEQEEEAVSTEITEVTEHQRDETEDNNEEEEKAAEVTEVISKGSVIVGYGSTVRR